MVEKSKSLLSILQDNPTFVIGTGRTGTHWVGYSLARHPQIRATVEVEPMFSISTKIALDPDKEGKLYWRLVLAYRWQLLKSTPKLYLDKSHPNIWIADKLKETFPQARFIGIERSPYATVASMMKHEGVSAWHRRWREFPVPNRFLGITEELAEDYDTIPFASQCALRWLAHSERMKEVGSMMKNDLLVISYETFARNTESVIHDLQQFLGLDSPIRLPEVRKESLHKWKGQLSVEEVEQIQSVVTFPPDAFE